MKQIFLSAQKTLSVTLNILLSPCCPVCRDQIAYSEGICSDCFKKIPPASSPIKTHDNYTSIIWSCVPYEGTIRKCLHELKYRANYQMNLTFFEILRRLPVKKMFIESKANIIIPVPMHRDRYKERGFNQTILFSKFLSTLSGIHLGQECLTRIHPSRPQTGLSRPERINNITKNIFSVPYPDRVKNKNIVLVDDILTTGTTLKSCAEVLLDSGARSVYGFTIAKTM